MLSMLSCAPFQHTLPVIKGLTHRLSTVWGPSLSSCFGELALLYSAPRAATVRATTTCRLWVMSRSVYHAVKRNFTSEQFSARHQLLDSVPALKHLSAHHRALLVDALTQVCATTVHACLTSMHAWFPASIA